MNESGLRHRLTSRTTLVLGDVAETTRTQTFAAPIGFAAMDLDFYSSTATALGMLRRDDVTLLRKGRPVCGSRSTSITSMTYTSTALPARRP